MGKRPGNSTRRLGVAALAAIGLVALVSVAFADTLRTYSDHSAHGNLTSGVNRSSLPSGVYATGNCAHCHEQHSLIEGQEPNPTGGSGPYVVFSAGMSNTDNFCFNCHGTGGAQSVTNYNYTYRFGNFTSNPVTTIGQAFGFEGSGGSAHTLDTIATWAYDLSKHVDWGWVKSGSQNATNPCLGCHDVHRAMRTVDSVDASKAAIILPQAHNPADGDGLYCHLWGDDAASTLITRKLGGSQVWVRERQDDLNYWPQSPSEAVRYQAPLRKGGGYEPDGSATYDGSNTPNYTEQCLACHRVKATNTTKIRWDNTIAEANRQRHGLGQEEFNYPTNWGDLKPPYVRLSEDPSWATDPKRNFNYAVGCLDCHEPHGSRLPYLLREEVNGWAGSGGTGINVGGQYQWLDFCQGCHAIKTHWTPTMPPEAARCSDPTWDCHGHDKSRF